MISRVPILDVRPQLEGGRYPVKAVVNEPVWVQARVFGEGRSIIAAAAILTGPDGLDREPVPLEPIDNDFWGTDVRGDEPGEWTFRIESWTDPYATWLRDAPIRIEAGVDVELTLAEGAELLGRAGFDDAVFRQELLVISDPTKPELDRLVAGMSVSPYFEAVPLRDHVGSSAPLPLYIDRERALFGSWYEFFPRSEGAVRDDDGTITSGTLKTAMARLEDIAAMGFDVIYLPPIHPISTVNRRGRDNSPTADEGDPGSPWTIGSADGGHDAVHPELGTIEDFDAFAARARELGIEVALDFALQCAPDHPWVEAHPEWFTTRVDGSIALDGDVHPLDFDSDPPGLYAEIVRVLGFWVDHGVTIFRVDSPHTKPLWLWERLLKAFRRVYPEVIFLADAFTVPSMLHALATVGFHQSYTYIAWREDKGETADYLEEVARVTSHFLRPNFFVNTPDILPRHLQTGDPSIFKARAVLAATGSPSWGMYAGYELLEHEPLAPGSEEYLHSEKYEVKVRDWDNKTSIAPFISRLNELRRRHPALKQLRNLYVHGTDDDSVLCFSKRAGTDVIVVVVDLDPTGDKTIELSINPADLGLRWGVPYLLNDELSGQATTANAVTITKDQPARIFAVVTP